MPALACPTPFALVRTQSAAPVVGGRYATCQDPVVHSSWCRTRRGSAAGAAAHARTMYGADPWGAVEHAAARNLPEPLEVTRHLHRWKATVGARQQGRATKQCVCSGRPRASDLCAGTLRGIGPCRSPGRNLSTADRPTAGTIIGAPQAVRSVVPPALLANRPVTAPAQVQRRALVRIDEVS